MGGMALSVSSASADYVYGVGPLYNGSNWMCVDDPGWSTSWGTQMQLWGCTGGANQKWKEMIVTECTYGGDYCWNDVMIQNQYSGLCLGVYGDSNADWTSAIQWACDPNDNAELFRVFPSTNGPPYWVLCVINTGTCLNDPGQSANYGTQLIFYHNDYTAAEIWYNDQWVGQGP
ncbi:MAG: RICIN domain-containing protein [Acidimicrobiaceae bacterium]|nr:RICIN domain-containing protein [Acidimicrobiaceae bacterium]